MDIVQILKEHFNDHMTDEIAESIKTAFELGISEKVSEEKTKIKETLEEEYKVKFEQSVIDLEEKLNTYIEKANVELIDENLKQEESKAKVELAEKLVDGILSTIKENNLEIAVEDKDIIKQLEEEKAQLEKSLNDSVDDITESKKEKLELEKAIAVLTMTEALTDVDTEKVVSMIEHVECRDIDDFKTKLETSIKLVEETKETKDDVIEENFDTKTPLDDFLPKY